MIRGWEYILYILYVYIIYVYFCHCDSNCHCWSGVPTGASIVDICDTHKRNNTAQNNCLTPPQCKLQGIKIETFHSSRQNLLHNKIIKQTSHLAVINVLVARLMVENELQHDLYTISCWLQHLWLYNITLLSSTRHANQDMWRLYGNNEFRLFFNIIWV